MDHRIKHLDRRQLYLYRPQMPLSLPPQTTLIDKRPLCSRLPDKKLLCYLIS